MAHCTPANVLEVGKLSRSSEKAFFSVLPLRDAVVFPHMVVPLFIGRDKAVRAIQSVDDIK